MLARKSTQASVRRILKILVLVGTAIKSTETSSCIVQLKQELKCMHSVRVSSQLLVSVLFIAVPINAKNFKFFNTFILTYNYMYTIHCIHA